MADYEIMVCPVCMGQVEPEYEGPTGHYHEGYAGTVEPVTIPASVLAKKLSDAVKAAQPRLEEQRQEEAERIKKREEWEALPKEERERIEAERWAAMSPEQKAMKQLVDGSIADMCRNLNRQAFNWSEAKISAKPCE